MALVGRVMSIAREEGINPVNINIDTISIGAGVVDRLKEQGWQVNGVSVSESPMDKKFFNKRAELGFAVKEWLKTGKIPMDDDFYEFCNIHYNYHSSGCLLLESKMDMRKRGLKSSDIFDALALTFHGGNRFINVQPTYHKNLAYYPDLGY
jgi:hypothetical protein